MPRYAKRVLYLYRDLLSACSDQCVVSNSPKLVLDDDGFWSDPSFYEDNKDEKKRKSKKEKKIIIGVLETEIFGKNFPINPGEGPIKLEFTIKKLKSKNQLSTEENDYEYVNEETHDN